MEDLFDTIIVIGYWAIVVAAIRFWLLMSETIFFGPAGKSISSREEIDDSNLYNEVMIDAAIAVDEVRNNRGRVIYRVLVDTVITLGVGYVGMKYLV